MEVIGRVGDRREKEKKKKKNGVNWAAGAQEWPVLLQKKRRGLGSGIGQEDQQWEREEGKAGWTGWTTGAYQNPHFPSHKSRPSLGV